MNYSTITELNLNNKSSDFVDIEYSDRVELIYKKKDIHEPKVINFKNCKFKVGFLFTLYIKESNIKEIEVNFINCIIENNGHSDNIINFNKDNQRLIISFHNCIVDNFIISNCSLSNFTASQSIFVNGLQIVNSKIERIRLRNCFGHFTIASNFETIVMITYTDNDIYFNYKISRDYILELLKDLNIKKLFEYKTVLNFSKNKGYHLYFNKSEKSGIQKESREDGTIKDVRFYLKKSEIKLLDISLKIKFDDDFIQGLEVFNGFFKDIEFNGESKSNIYIRNTSCNRLFINRFSSSKLHLYNFKANRKNSQLEFKESDLTNAWFNKVNLKSFELVNIYSTSLEKAKFSATNFPDNIEALKNIHFPNDKEEEYFDNKYENYKQIKIALINQHNHIQALELHSKMYEVIRKSKTLSGQDRFILCLNHWSNKHGTSIKYALFNFLFVLTVLVVSYNLALPDAPYNFDWQGFESFYLSIIATFKFITSNLENAYTLANPTHRINSLILNSPNGALSPMNYIISFLSRILIGWAYFQFISAFRKFGKKI